MSLSHLLALGTLSPLLCCLVLPLSVRAFALFNHILFCLIWLLSHGGLFFFEGRQKGVDGGEGRKGETEGNQEEWKEGKLWLGCIG